MPKLGGKFGILEGARNSLGRSLLIDHISGGSLGGASFGFEVHRCHEVDLEESSDIAEDDVAIGKVFVSFDRSVGDESNSFRIVHDGNDIIAVTIFGECDSIIGSLGEVELSSSSVFAS